MPGGVHELATSDFGHILWEKTIPMGLRHDLKDMHGTRYEGKVVDEEDPEPYQSTRTQLMAAEKGFFDAHNGSLFFRQSKLSTTTEETQSVLWPDSFFNLDDGKTPTLRFGGSWRNRGKITDTGSSFKTLVPRSNWKPSGSVQVPGTNSPQPPTSTEFAKTIDTPKPSTPEGTTFTQFVAFATPNPTPEPTQKDISPLTFSPLRNVIQDPPRQKSGTKPYGKFVGFGLLDEDQDTTSLDLAPNSFPKPGKRARDEKEELVKEVMGFMGRQIWDIDEELKKMAGWNQTTKDADTGKKRRGLRR